MMLCLNEEGKPVVAFGPQMNAEGRKTCKWVELQGVDFQRYINSVDGEIKMGRKTKVIPHPLMASIKATHTDAGFKHFVWNTEYILTGTLHNVELKAPEKQNVVEILDEDINKKFLHFVLQKNQTQKINCENPGEFAKCINGLNMIPTEYHVGIEKVDIETFCKPGRTDGIAAAALKSWKKRNTGGRKRVAKHNDNGIMRQCDEKEPELVRTEPEEGKMGRPQSQQISGTPIDSAMRNLELIRDSRIKFEQTLQNKDASYKQNCKRLKTVKRQYNSSWNRGYGGGRKDYMAGLKGVWWKYKTKKGNLEKFKQFEKQFNSEMEKLIEEIEDLEKKIGEYESKNTHRRLLKSMEL